MVEGKGSFMPLVSPADAQAVQRFSSVYAWENPPLVHGKTIGLRVSVPLASCRRSGFFRGRRKPAGECSGAVSNGDGRQARPSPVLHTWRSGFSTG
jgi:hypothetical protein